MAQETREDDLELKELGQFIGSESYHCYLCSKLTDGIVYVMHNGYSWFVTDALAIIRLDKRLLAEPFLAVKLKLKADLKNPEWHAADLIITDGNSDENPFLPAAIRINRRKKRANPILR